MQKFRVYFEEMSVNYVELSSFRDSVIQEAIDKLYRDGYLVIRNIEVLEELNPTSNEYDS